MPVTSIARGATLRRLAVQQAATRALSEAASLPEALSGILESVCLALEWQVGEAWTIDPHTGALRIAAEWPAGGCRGEGASAGRSRSLPSQVWANGRPVFVPDLGADGPLGREAESGTQAAIGVPLDVDGEAVGVLVFRTRGGAGPDAALLAMLGSIGQQIGNVIRRRQAEAALRASEARTRAVLEASLDAIVSVDAEGTITGLNPAAERTFGYSAAQAVGQPMVALLIPPHLRGLEIAKLTENRDGAGSGIFGRRVELEAMRKDGSVFPAEIAITSVIVGGEPCITAYVRDISDRRQADERLREEIRINDTLQRLALSFATERDRETLIQLITDTATVLIEARHGAFFSDIERLPVPRDTPLRAPVLGGAVVRRADVRGDPTLGAVEPPVAGDAPVASYLAVPVKAPSGDTMGELVFGHPEPDRFTLQHERIVAGIAAHAAVALENLGLYDRLKKSEETAHAAYRMLADAARRKDEFIAMLSHELRNPLAPIMTAIELMRMDSDPATLESSRIVIERQAQHLLRLVDDLLDVSRITRGKISLDRRTLAVREVLDSAIEMASPLFERKAHRLHVEADDDLWVRGDRSRLAQVVTNLLTNAARYTEPGGNVWLSATGEGDEITISVRDDGMGMDPDLLDRAFEPFSQGKQAIDRSQGGLGLGLALVKSLVEMHGGTVEGRSEGPGRGSRFTVRLPAADGRGARRPSSPSGSVPAHRAHASRVLVVDDNADAAEIMGRGLRRLGYTVRVAHDGPSALAVARKLRPDVAVLDIGLPVMDGYELALRLRKEEGLSGVRLVAVTGYGQISDRMRSRAAGFDEHLIKPVAIGELARVIDA